MRIEHRIYLISIIMLIFSVFLLVYSAKNKEQKYRMYLIIYSVLGIICTFIDLAILPNVLQVNVSFDLLIYYLVGLIAGGLFIISIIVNIIKRTKNKIEKSMEDAMENSTISKTLVIAVVLAFAVPAIFLGTRIVRDIIVMSNSDMVIVFDSAGNGGLGDGETFGFVIKGDSCKNFDLGVDFGLDKFLGDSFVKVKHNMNDDRLEIGPSYKVVVDNDNIVIYHEDREIYTYSVHNHSPFLGDYFNISIKECYVKTS